MTGIIVLAAGASTRLGQAKQLVPWQGIPLIRHAALTALNANLGPVTVVLGAVVEPCRDALEGLELTITENKNWETGMGGSIAAGVKSLAAHGLENIIVTLCDQPLVTADDLIRLANMAGSCGPGIVASHNGNSFTPPILFPKNRFAGLASLTGAAGARELLAHEKSVIRFDLPHAKMDIDTPADLIDSQHWTPR